MGLLDSLSPGGIIGSGLSVLGSVAGAIGSARAQKKADKMVAQQKAKNQAWYERNYNQNFLQRSDAQQVLENTRKFYDERMKRSAGANVVMGGTDEALAMEKAAANETIADTMAGINADAASYKDAIEQNYMNQDMALAQQQIAGQQQRAQNIAQAGSNVSSMGAGILGSVLSKK